MVDAEGRRVAKSGRKAAGSNDRPRAAPAETATAKTAAAKTAPEEAAPADGRFRVRRFDADRRDRELTLKQALASSPRRRQLLWIDIRDGGELPEMDALARRFAFDERTQQALIDPSPRPHLVIHGSYVHVSVAVEPAADGAQPASSLHVVWDSNVVITRRTGEVRLLDEIDERIKSDTTLGAIDAAEFAALLLDVVVTNYLAAFDAIEDEIDRLDERSLRDEGRRRLLEDLVRLRQRIASLRRTVTRQRALFASLAGPDVRQMVGSNAADNLAAVASRFESALAAVEGSRTALLGSFDVYMTRTAQRTNDVMKVLTVATVLLLPGSVIAGLLGMNVVVPLNKDDPMSFWLVIAGVAALAVVVLFVARRRRWI